MNDCSMPDLRLGRYQDVLADVECDAIVADPPYSARTHNSHDAGATLANRGRWKRSDGGEDRCRPRSELVYPAWGDAEIEEFVAFWAPRCRGWFVVLSDSDLCLSWRRSFELHGLTGFQPLPCVIPGMTVRLSGDGPSSWAIYANVARPKRLHKWGTLGGAYGVHPQSGSLCGGQGEREHIGGKPIWLMRALIRDYTKRGDLICDPTAGAATTLIAAYEEGRRGIGAEVDPETHEKGVARLMCGHTPSFDFGGGDGEAA